MRALHCCWLLMVTPLITIIKNTEGTELSSDVHSLSGPLIIFSLSYTQNYHLASLPKMMNHTNITQCMLWSETQWAANWKQQCISLFQPEPGKLWPITRSILNWVLSPVKDKVQLKCKWNRGTIKVGEIWLPRQRSWMQCSCIVLTFLKFERSFRYLV